MAHSGSNSDTDTPQREVLTNETAGTCPDCDTEVTSGGAATMCVDAGELHRRDDGTLSIYLEFTCPDDECDATLVVETTTSDPAPFAIIEDDTESSPAEVEA